MVSSNSEDDPSCSKGLFCRLAPPDAPTFHHRLMLSAPPHTFNIVSVPSHVPTSTCATRHMYHPAHVPADTCVNVEITCDYTDHINLKWSCREHQSVVGCHVVKLCHGDMRCHVMSCCHVMPCCHVMLCCHVISCCHVSLLFHVI